MGKKEIQRGSLSQLMNSSFGFSFGLVILFMVVDVLIGKIPVLSALADKTHADIVGTYSQMHDHVRDHWAGGDEEKTVMYIVVVVTQVLHTSLYWLHCGILSLFDLFPNLFSFAHRWKIQDQGTPVSKMKLLKCALTCLFNQVFVNGPLSYLMLNVTIKSGMSVDPADIPSFGTLIKNMVVFAIVEEIGFYYGHRLMHQPWFYKRFHKQHHEWTSPVGFVAIYADPIEHITSNLLPVMMGPWICGSHVIVYWFWLIVAVHVTICVHSGYHFPLTPSPEFHDFHHLKFNVNYGVIGFLDWFHKTDAMFYEKKFKSLSDRDRVFFSLSDIDYMKQD